MTPRSTQIPDSRSCAPMQEAGRAARAEGRWQKLARDGGRRVFAFAVVGVLSTVVHLGLFAGLRSLFLSAQVANVLALVVATIFNTAANRRWTFQVRGKAGALRHQVQGFLVFGLTLGLTASGLGLLHALVAVSPTWLETLTVAAATSVATVVKYVLMRTWMFGAGSALPQESEAATLTRLGGVA